MLKEAIQAIHNLFEDQAGKLTPLPEDSRRQRFLLNNGRHGKPEILSIKKEIFERAHKFSDLQSFVAFLKRPDAGRTALDTVKDGHPGLVFVAENYIQASLLYGHPLSHTASLNIKESEEFQAIRTLSQGVSQKALWRFLVTSLDAKVDPSLLLQISSLGIKSKDDREFTIRSAGLGQGKASNALIVSTLNPTTGEQVSEIRTDWGFNVPLWDCFDRSYVIQTVLEIVPTDQGLKFFFHIKSLADILRVARRDLVEDISAELPDNFAAYCGDYGAVTESD